MPTPTSSAPALSPRQLFEDTLRPAELLLRVYRLLECDVHQNSGDLLQSMRPLVGATNDEDLLLIANEIFIGVIREKAAVSSSEMKRARLDSLLRQSVVVSCTALETYLPTLLRKNLPLVIAAKGRDFFPRDPEVKDYFSAFTFSLADGLRIWKDDKEAPTFIANKILGFIDYRYLSSSKAINTAALLLSVSDPWVQIAARLGRGAEELKKTVDDTTQRRNNIVHRADRKKVGGEIEDISFAFAKSAVDTISHVCLALDELVAARVSELATATD